MPPGLSGRSHDRSYQQRSNRWDDHDRRSISKAISAVRPMRNFVKIEIEPYKIQCRTALRDPVEFRSHNFQEFMDKCFTAELSPLQCVTLWNRMMLPIDEPEG